MKAFIIIPAYNEEGNIGKLLSDLINLKLQSEKQIIVVDDGSVDKTLQIVRSFSSKLDLEVIVHAPNKGIPQTFYDGLKKASELAKDNDVIVIMEGDCTSDLKILPTMISKVNQGSGIVIASRYLKGGKYKNFPLHRTWGSNLVNLVLKLFFYQKNITDYTIFYRAYSARAVKKAFDKYRSKLITTKSFAANLEILLKIGEFSSSNAEVPLVYDYGLKKGSSKMKLFKTLFEYKDLILRKLFGEG